MDMFPLLIIREEKSTSILRIDDAESHFNDKNTPTHTTAAFLSDNDGLAVTSFLNQYKNSPSTFRTYSKECERFLLWVKFWQKSNLNTLKILDFESYLAFLKSPNLGWCGQRTNRMSKDWRPFVGPLSPKAIQIAIASINSMMDWLLDATYIQSNPLRLMRQKSKRITPIKTVDDAAGAVSRYLDDDMWAAFSNAVEQLPRENEEDRLAYERARFIGAMMYLLCPRAGEMETHTMGSFREISGYWFWCVVGKGGKAGRVAAPDDMLKALIRYRVSMGLSPLPGPEDQTPLIPAIRGSGSITARRLNQLLKKLFSSAADLLSVTSIHKAEKIKKASAHWMRHTSITAKVNAGMDRYLVQQDARHSDQRTTAMYTHNEDIARHEESQKHKLNWPT